MINKTRGEFKRKIANRENVFACWTSIGHPSITEMFARSGVDFIGIDIEHSTISQEQSQRIIAAAQSEGIVCLPRIASHNMEMIKRLLDSGADGLIVPMVNTPDEVEKIISWCKYSPIGNRSFGIARGQGYGFDFDEYTKSWNDSSTLIVQIESIEGVENIEKILSYPEIDGVMVGPYDMSGSLGIPGQLEHPKIVEACKTVIKACEKYKKACGTQVIEPNLESMKKAIDDGFTFTVLSSDIFLMWKWSARMKGYIEEINK
ncbi:MAG: aldolase/citrate lyase family protein [Candidatus Margulisiibacteriota bacterium]